MKLFIGGTPRSGTSALCKLLNSDTDTLISDEFNIMLDDERTIEERINFINIQKKKEDFRDYTFNRFDKIKFEGEKIDDLFQDFTVVGDKTPSYCFPGNVNNILKNYPDAKFIFCIRDYRDFIWSSIRNYRDGSREGWTKSNVKSAAEIWNYYIVPMLSSIRFINPENLFICRYEEFCERPRSLVYELSHFLDHKLNCDTSTYYSVNLGAWKNSNINLKEIPRETINLGRILGYEYIESF